MLPSVPGGLVAAAAVLAAPAPESAPVSSVSLAATPNTQEDRRRGGIKARRGRENFVADAQQQPQQHQPGIPGAATARTLLAGLDVRRPGSGRGYSRAKFPNWQTVGGTCSTREVVLQRDGDAVEVDDECRAVAGRWLSPYDGEAVTDASDIDIDHMVPLKNAWILWAVSASSNREKSDNSPDEWAPPVQSFHCVYARSWVQVKSAYQLTVTAEEKCALDIMLDTC